MQVFKGKQQLHWATQEFLNTYQQGAHILEMALLQSKYHEAEHFLHELVIVCKEFQQYISQRACYDLKNQHELFLAVRQKSYEMLPLQLAVKKE